MIRIFKDIDINTSEKKFVEYFAKEYIKLRSGKNHNITSNPIFNNSGFDVSELQKTILKGSVKKSLQLNNGKLNPKDLYRSELGEMLMTYYFEKKLEESERFVIPVKLIADKETAEMPSRGIDCIGFREEEDKIHLLLGEAKVSDEKKNPPQVVKQIYETQKILTEQEKLVEKLSDFSKKIPDTYYGKFITLIAFIVFGKTINYSITYGCTLVRDKDCVNINSDFGKMKTNQSEFDPHNIHFVIMCFKDQTIDDTVKNFFEEVQRQIES